MAFLSESYEENVKTLDELFKGCADITGLEVSLKYMDEAKGKIYFMESAVTNVTIRKVIFGLTDVFELTSIDDIVATIMAGNACMIIDGKNYALKIRSDGYPSLGVQQASDEQVLRGSNEGFSDSYKTNSSLIRKRLRTHELKVEESTVGVRSNTGIALVYMESVVRKDVLKEVKKRLKSFETDGILDSGVIEQLTMDNDYSFFPQYMTTQRPDKAALAILNGQIVVLVDNTPIALILPVNFSSFLKAADDYYNRWEIVSFVRLLRYIAVFFAMSLPALYISIMNYHPEILPPDIANAFIEARQGIPFPVVVEVFILEISFELIREAGVRIPGPMGNTIGIVGGLIVGSAAVDASLASPIMVIVVALTALCSFTIPNTEFSSAFRLLKYYLIILSAVWGIFGYLLGILSIIVHLSGLKSYGFPYLGPMAGGDVNNYEDEKDFVLRLPYMYMKRRPIFAKADNRKRFAFKSDNGGHKSK